MRKPWGVLASGRQFFAHFAITSVILCSFSQKGDVVAEPAGKARGWRLCGELEGQNRWCPRWDSNPD